jgi:hypothetical protein
MKTCTLKFGEEFVLTPRTGNTTGPESWISLHMSGHIFVRNDVTDRHQASSTEDTKYLAKKLLAVFRPHQIENAVGHGGDCMFL